jgi:hypothetical protein
MLMDRWIMETKHALIIGICIIIGFAIEPLTQSEPKTEPNDDLIMVTTGEGTWSIRLKDQEWYLEEGLWRSEMGLFPADKDSLRAIIAKYGKNVPVSKPSKYHDDALDHWIKDNAE